MALTTYFTSDQLDSPATEDDISHVEEVLGLSVPSDLRAFWLTSATFNGQVQTAAGAPGAYLRILHPHSAIEATRRSKAEAQTPGILVFGSAEDWDYGVIPGSPTTYVDVDRDTGEVLSDLGSTFVAFLESLRTEHAAEDDLLA